MKPAQKFHNAKGQHTHTILSWKYNVILKGLGKIAEGESSITIAHNTTIGLYPDNHEQSVAIGVKP